MKFPSFETLFQGFINTLKRFPIELVAATTGTITAMVVLEHDKNNDFSSDLFRLILCANLALVLFLSITVMSEARKMAVAVTASIRVAALVLILFIYFLLDPIAVESSLFRFAFLTVSFHLFVSFAPFIGRGSLAGFWEYNKVLFLRILTAALYSAVLYIGLAAAIGTTHVLFNLDLDYKIYAHLFFAIAGIFNTAFFLSGIPSNWESLDNSQAYPRGLKIFTQYVLIPLATIYVAILLTYEAKILIQWSLPKGLVSSLILGYAVYGILSILLVYPIRNDQENRWIQIYGRLFYFLLIPLIALMALAVWARVDQYGITESRYILIVTVLWLAGITLYFLLSKAENIKVIPLSLSIIALLLAWGPQSAASVSRASQQSRLKQFFEQHQSISDGKIQPIAGALSSNEGEELIDFLMMRYGTDALRPLVAINLDSLLQATDTIEAPYHRLHESSRILTEYFGVAGKAAPTSNHYSANASGGAITIKGFDKMLPVSKRFDLDINPGNTLIVITLDSIDYSFEMDSLCQFMMQSTRGRQLTLAQDKMVVHSSDGRASLFLKEFSFNFTNNQRVLVNYNGYLFIKDLNSY